MSWREWLRGSRAVLTAAQRQRLTTWQQGAEVSPAIDARHATFAVVDVETSGLDANRDRLLAIGAVKIVAARIALAQSFYLVVRQTYSTDRANILVHRIGGAEQVAGIEPAEALLGFLAFIGKDPLVAFNAPFDATVLRRAARESLGVKLDRPWLDLAFLAPALVSGAPRRAPLDYWLERYGVMPRQRHHALADAEATARLLQILIAAAAGTPTVADLFEAERSERWIERASRQSL